jgi:hypothetical protein
MKLGPNQVSFLAAVFMICFAALVALGKVQISADLAGTLGASAMGVVLYVLGLVREPPRWSQKKPEIPVDTDTDASGEP